MPPTVAEWALETKSLAECSRVELPKPYDGCERRELRG